MKTFRRALSALLVPLLLLIAAPASPAAPPSAPSPLSQMTAALRAGRYGEVTALHEKFAPQLRTPEGRGQAASLLAQVLILNGKQHDAQLLLEATVLRYPAQTEPLLQLGLCYRRTGQHDRERQVWNRFFDDHDAGTLDQKDPAALRALAIAARHLGSYQDANDTFRQALEVAKAGKTPRDKAEAERINVEWAALFLEKYEAGYAEVSLKEALAQDPDDPEARVLLARVKLEQGNDVAAAEQELHRALAVNPRHPLALGTRAEILLDNEQYDDALRTTSAMLHEDPTDLQALTLSAAAHFLLDHAQKYAELKKRVLLMQPDYTEFHRTLAELLTTQHRYDDAVTLLEEAVALNPKDAYALSALGSGYLRQGEDDKGMAALRRAWTGDKFNVRTYNLLNLFEKVIPRDYDVVTLDIDGSRKGKGKGGLRLRLPRAEREVLLPLLLPFLQAEWQDLVSRYHFTPRLPVTLELYAQPEHYGVRTVGLPNLAALGVTFGQVVTGRSPAGEAFNWGLMIWHEMSHVFAIQLSRSRVPRWFTEGLSEWETAHHDPDWTRRTRAELYAALRDGKLIPITELNTGFTRARDVAHIVVAYHEAAAAMDFLVRRFGFARIVSGLSLFGSGKSTQEVLSQMSGLSPPALDAAFRADLRERLSPYEGTFFVRPSDFSDEEALQADLKQHPDDARLHGLHALSLLGQGHADQAMAAAQQALKLDPHSREGLLCAGDILRKRKDPQGAEKSYRLLLQSAGDGYDVRLRLGMLAADRDDVTTAEQEFSRAKQLDPDRPEPYGELAKLYTKLKREDDALREMKAAVHLEINDAELARLLVKRLHAAKRWAEVAEYGALARFLCPYNVDLRAQVGEALLLLGRRPEATAELSAALLLLPKAGDGDEEQEEVKKRRAELQALKARAEGKKP